MGTGQTGGKHGFAGTPHELHPNDAGLMYDPKSNTWGDARSFKGSGVRSYLYSRVINGIKRTVTIRAHNIDEADRIALRLGYKTSDRDIKRRRRKGSK